jgi:hypothetical protein
VAQEARPKVLRELQEAHPIREFPVQALQVVQEAESQELQQEVEIRQVEAGTQQQQEARRRPVR